MFSEQLRRPYEGVRLPDMPEYARPTHQDTALADLFGGAPARVAIVVALLQRPEGATVAALCAATGLSDAVIRSQLRPLLAAGAASSTQDPTIPGRGQRPTYRVHRGVVLQSLQSFARQTGFVVAEADDASLQIQISDLVGQLAQLLNTGRPTRP